MTLAPDLRDLIGVLLQLLRGDEEGRMAARDLQRPEIRKEIKAGVVSGAPFPLPRHFSLLLGISQSL